MILAVKRSVENMHAIAYGFELQTFSIDIGSQFVISEQRVRKIAPNFLKFCKSRNFNLVRDSHMTRCSPHRIRTDNRTNSVAIVQRISAKGIIYKHRLHRARPLSYKFAIHLNE